MRATAAPEEGNKVRLSVEIDETEMEVALNDVMRRLAREVRVPGFRPGKVPRKVIEARMGGVGAVRGEALRDALPDFYAKAVIETDVDPIDQPDIEITAGEESGPVTFEAIVEVRPEIDLIGYQGLVVELPSLEVTDEEVDEQIDRLRATSGEMADVERPIVEKDQVTIDIVGTRIMADAGEDADGSEAGGEDATDDDGADQDLRAEDFLYQVGSATVLPELDEHLLGKAVGDEATFVSDIAPGEQATFVVTVKGIKELVLPQADDAWAAEASEFETVEALRADLAGRLAERRLMGARLALQQKTIDALVELVNDEVPPQMVDMELRERIHDLNHRLEAQGMSVGQFLGATGRTEEDFLAELRVGAEQSVKADLALRALAEAEGLEISDEELDEELAAMGERLGLDAVAVRGQLEQAGRLSTVRSDRRKAKAMTWLTEHVELVDENGAPVDRAALQDNDEEDGE